MSYIVCWSNIPNSWSKKTNIMVDHSQLAVKENQVGQRFPTFGQRFPTLHFINAKNYENILPFQKIFVYLPSLQTYC